MHETGTRFIKFYQIVIGFWIAFVEGGMNLFDLHCDTLYECCETGRHLRENDLHINQNAAGPYQHYAQFFALFCGARPPDDEKNQNHKTRRSLLDLPPENRLGCLLETARREFAANADWLVCCTTAAGLEQAIAAGKTAAFLSIEGAELLVSEAHLTQAYEAGVRMVTLSWNDLNQYACGALYDNNRGLSPRGRTLVQKLCEMGILLDVSHLSEQGFWDVCALTDRPFVASHSDAYALCRHPRNLTEEQFAEIVRRGGLAGINLYVPFLVRQGGATLDDVIGHVEYFLGLHGERAIALGCDFDGCDRLPAGISGLHDLYRLADRMLALGYQESTVNNLFYENAFAFIKKML